MARSGPFVSMQASSTTFDLAVAPKPSSREERRRRLSRGEGLQGGPPADERLRTSSATLRGAPPRARQAAAQRAASSALASRAAGVSRRLDATTRAESPSSSETCSRNHSTARSRPWPIRSPP